MLDTKDINNISLFIHIPKCAGTSIEKLFGYEYDSKMYTEHCMKLSPTEHPKHLTLKSYYDNFNNNIIDNAFKFTIIRNPFELMVSNYNYAINNESVYLNDTNDSELKKEITFERFIIFIYNESKKDDTLVSQNVSSFSKFIEYKDYKMDFIGRFENLKEDVDFICNKLNIENTLEITNRLEYDRDYRKYYNKLTRDIIEHLFYYDLKKYNYKF